MFHEWSPLRKTNFWKTFGLMVTGAFLREISPSFRRQGVITIYVMHVTPTSPPTVQTVTKSADFLKGIQFPRDFIVWTLLNTVNVKWSNLTKEL